MISAIFDIDGTLCEVSECRLSFVKGPGKKDWDAFHADAESEEANHHVANLCRSLSNSGYNILISTGRSAKYRAATVRWMTRMGIPWHRAWFRADDDFRPSSDVKRDHWVEMVAAGYRPVMSFDDRDADTKLWRSLDIVTFQVAEGRF